MVYNMSTFEHVLAIFHNIKRLSLVMVYAYQIIKNEYKPVNKGKKKNTQRFNPTLNFNIHNVYHLYYDALNEMVQRLYL